MIKKILVKNARSEVLDLELSSPEKSGLAVVQVTNLGAPDTSSNVYEFPIKDGGYNGLIRAIPREIVFTLKYLDPIEYNRRLCYRRFPLKEDLEITFITTSGVRVITGRVEKHEALVFSQECGATITIKCAEPYFKEKDSIIITEDYATPEFEFPFGDPSPFVMSDIVAIYEGTDLHFRFVNDGEVLSGAEYVFDVTTASGSSQDEPYRAISIYNYETRQGSQIYLNNIKDHEGLPTTLLVGDSIRLNTSTREFKMVRIINGIRREWSIINCLPRDFTWPMIAPGYNDIEMDEQNSSAEYNKWFKYDRLYVGV